MSHSHQHDIGMVGLGTMGRNLLLNIADHGFTGAGLNRGKDKIELLKQEANGKDLVGYQEHKYFVAALKKPRVMILLVPAGKPVDDVINEMIPLLEEGDMIVDGGNSYYRDTDRRAIELEKHKIGFFGMGVSGGEDGARHGPSMMPGGPVKLWERMRPILEAVSAKAEDGLPCVDLMGPRSSGHYVKTIHNGIEYGLMQTIAELYDGLHRGLGWNNHQVADLFRKWDSGNLRGFLVNITHQVLSVKDADTGKDLVDLISDKAKQKGTGKWTSQDAMDLGVPIPTIDAAVAARELSSYKDERTAAGAKFALKFPSLPAEFGNEVEKAFRLAMILTYAQGFVQLAAASTEYSFDLDMERVAKIWRAGCIIRSAFLQDIMDAFKKNPHLPNLIMDDEIAAQAMELQASLRKVVGMLVASGIPCPSLAASLTYFDSYISPRLPANLIQAQRDYFGAHTYERLDQPGSFHTKWATLAGEQN